MQLSSYINDAANVVEFKIKHIIPPLKAVHRLLTLTDTLNITQIPVLTHITFFHGK
jgi:hypothetical protein